MTGNDASAEGANTRDTQRAAFEPWPDWEITDIPALARYVSVPALDEIGMAAPRRYTQPDTGWKSGKSIAREVYESIRELKLKYMHSPWRFPAFKLEAVPRQRVRYPAWVRRDSGGTCLDLAILYATALMRAQIRPYIAIMYDSRFSPRSVYGEREGHAFVVADLREPLTVQLDQKSWPSPLELVKAGELRVQTGQDWPDCLLAVDPTYATTDFSPSATDARVNSFSQATAEATGYLSNVDIKLCDIANAQGPGLFPPLGRPADSSTPAIWTRLPEMPAAKRYPSREEAFDSLMKARGRIVIYGDPGFGKSTLACARARQADGGYGWFLNAADRSALQSALAQAEIEQTERGYRQPLERLDLVPFSDAAIRRLEVSDAPWVLVLDNANGDPGEIGPQLLPRTIRANQTVIVTTTNRAWLEAWPKSDLWPTTTHVVLGELGSGDMLGVDSGLRGRLGGSPLFYEAALAAVEAGARVPDEPANDASLNWQLARDLLAGEPGALDLAHLIAWGPPVAQPTAAFEEFFSPTRARDGEFARLARLLEQAGLIRFLTRPVAAMLMHRLIAERIRQDERLIRIGDHEPLPAPVALLVTDAGQRLMTTYGDGESFQRLEDALDAERPARVPARSWGLALYGIARAGEIRGRSKTSSKLFEKAIGCLDESRDRSLLSECWNGRARYLKDNPPADVDERIAVLASALSWALRAQELAREAAAAEPEGDGHWWNLIRQERARAMEALIIKTQARDTDDPVRQKAQYALSLEMLEKSENKRRVYLEKLGIKDSPDMDRARFNLGGPCLSLAKLSRDAEAEGYMRRGLRAYEEAKRIRVERHGAGVALASIASCDSGIAMIYHYSALMKVDPQRNETDAFRPISPQTRMALLRRASTACAEALRDRTVLAPADRDDEDAVKSDELTIKIADTRKLLSALHAREGRPLSKDEAAKLLGKPAAEAVDEARDLGCMIEKAHSGGE